MLTDIHLVVPWARLCDAYGGRPVAKLERDMLAWATTTRNWSNQWPTIYVAQHGTIYRFHAARLPGHTKPELYVWADGDILIARVRTCTFGVRAQARIARAMALWQAGKVACAECGRIMRLADACTRLWCTRPYCPKCWEVLMA